MRLLPILFLITGSFTASGQIVYKDSNQPIDKRVQDLLKRMTPEEKFWQLFMIPGDLDDADSLQYRNGLFGFQVSTKGKGDELEQMLRYGWKEDALGLAHKINRIQKYFVEKTRLGIPIIPFDEALHGLVREGATVFPQAIALAATWDTALMSKVANVIAMETKLRNVRQVLSPVVNIASDVRWGRTEETYGEDPFLVSAMAVSFVSAFEKNGIITTPKHFVANVGDGGRDSYPVHINERLLEEIYFPPFKACIEKGGSRSIMTAYNSVNGIASSSNSWLLQQKLKNQWGFTGFVISDANAVGGEVVLHNTAKDYAESGMHAINNGLDVIFQTEHKHHTLFDAAFYDGRIDSSRINDAVSRVLQAKFELGLFENPYVKVADGRIFQGDAPGIARKAALESVVLLKNERNILPLDYNLKAIALIGADALSPALGGYSGPATKAVSLLKGLRLKLKEKVHVYDIAGPLKWETDYYAVPETCLSNGSSPGLKAEYFNNILLDGTPLITRVDKKIDFHWTLYGPEQPLSSDNYSVRWTGQIHSQKTGTINIGLEGSDGFRMFLNNKLVIDNWKKQSYRRLTVDHYFEKGKTYDIRVEFFEPVGNATIKLIWKVGKEDWKKAIDEAVTAAKKSDVAIVTVGIDEGEFRDRAMLSLPGHQEELIHAVAATGKPVIIIIVGGSAITMNNWIGKVAGIIDAWYPGDEGGNAIADILFGDYNPAGRLPITFPMHEAQLPLVYNHKPTGRGDDYNNLTGLPLFPFGFGLSYTQFEYSNIQLNRTEISPTGEAILTCVIRNTGKMDGDEVVQLYIRDIQASVARPVMELKGFQRIHLKAGESKMISFVIAPEMLSMLDINLKKVVEPGDFRIMIGASSRDIRLKETLTVR